MLNKVILMGRLTADPELRHTQRNVPVASFTLAVQRRFKSDETDFIDIVAWEKNAEFVSKWFNKGKLVAVTGRLQIRNWKDKDGNNRRSAEVIAEECHFAEPKGAEQGSGAYQPRQAPQPPAQPQQLNNYQAAPLSDAPVYNEAGFSELLEDDEELPF